jgi:hypothetical protein
LAGHRVLGLALGAVDGGHDRDDQDADGHPGTHVPALPPLTLWTGAHSSEAPSGPGPTPPRPPSQRGIPGAHAAMPESAVVPLRVVGVVLLLLRVAAVTLSVKDRVFAAAEQISAERRPTVSTVRALAGVSNAGATRYLKEWSEEKQAAGQARRRAGGAAGTGGTPGRGLLGGGLRAG